MVAEECSPASIASDIRCERAGCGYLMAVMTVCGLRSREEVVRSSEYLDNMQSLIDKPLGPTRLRLG